MPSWWCSASYHAAPIASSSRPWLAWSTVTAWAASTDGCRYVTPVTSRPSRIREVADASAASVVIPSKQLPGPSPYMGTKWSKPHMPSKPRSSQRRTRPSRSSHSIRCWAMSTPKRIPVMPATVARRAACARGPLTPMIVGSKLRGSTHERADRATSAGSTSLCPLDPPFRRVGSPSTAPLEREENEDRKRRCGTGPAAAACERIRLTCGLQHRRSTLSGSVARVWCWTGTRDPQ